MEPSLCMQSAELVQMGQRDAQPGPIIQSYVYSELPPAPAPASLRLLRFESRSSSTYVKCELQVFALDRLPPFRCLSYCWGDPHREISLLCGEKEILITKTLQEAVEQLITRDRDSVEWLWIDQICIDQSNIQERESQVNMMKSIFQSSEGTIIWLGPRIPGIEKTSIVLKEMWRLHSIDQHKNGSRKRRLYTSREYEDTDLPPPDDQCWRIFGELLARPWFVRTWAIQEVAFSKVHPILLCGSDELNWELLLGSASWMQALTYNVTPLAQYTTALPALRSLHLFNDLKNIGLPWDLTTLLNKTIRFQATEPRDRVYSLMGLAGEARSSSSIPAALRADYKKTNKDVFRDVTRYIIESSMSLGILTRIRYLSDWEAFPSWVVDFAGNSNWDRLSYFTWGRHTEGWPASREMPNSASDGLLVELEACSMDDVLSLRGLKIDAMLSPCETMDKTNLDSTGSQVLSAWKRAYQQARTRYQTIEDLARAFMVTLAANWSLTETERMEHEPLRHFWAYLWRAYHMLCNDAESNEHRAAIELEFRALILSQNDDDPANPDLYGMHLNTAHHRKIFITRNRSYVGLGPSIMQQDDVVCVLFGGATPMILRPEGEYFRFVGECYVYDLMNGEAIEDWRAGKYTAETFHLI